MIISQPIARRTSPHFFLFSFCHCLSFNMSSDQMNVDTSDGKQNKEDVVYGDCEGPHTEYIKLVSWDSHEFILKRETALLSGTIRAMLTGPGNFVENETNVIHFKEIHSSILSEICCYLNYKKRYTNSATEIPDFPLSASTVLDLLLAANYLDC